MFLTTLASTDDRSPWGDFWFEPLSMRTSSGARVNAETAKKLGVVSACTRVLAESFAVMPAKLYQKQDGERRKPIYKHPLLTLLRKPNPYQNGYEWREMLQGHLALRGNGYNLVSYNSAGDITSLLPLHPDRMQVIPTDEWGCVYRYRFRDGTVKTFSRADIWHIRNLSSDGIVGESLIQQGADAIGLGLAAQDYGSRFFQNDAKPTGGWISTPNNFKDKAARDQFRESFQESQTGVNRHKTLVLEYGMEYHEIGVTNKDSQFIESRSFTVIEICRIFRVPPHLVADLTRATFANIEQQSLEFLIYTMTPWQERWKASIEGSLMLEEESEAFDIEFDEKRLSRGDRAARGAFYHSGILDGWMTRNEAREDDGREPLDGLDEPLVPLNVREESDPSPTADPAGEKPGMDNRDKGGQQDDGENDDAPPKPKDKPKPKPAPKENARVTAVVGLNSIRAPAIANARLTRLISGNVARMARRIVAGNMPPPDQLADALAIETGAAAAWIASLAPGSITDSDACYSTTFSSLFVLASNQGNQP
jgi:HK97 family phage portal protein